MLSSMSIRYVNEKSTHLIPNSTKNSRKKCKKSSKAKTIRSSNPASSSRLGRSTTVSWCRNCRSLSCRGTTLRWWAVPWRWSLKTEKRLPWRKKWLCERSVTVNFRRARRRGCESWMWLKLTSTVAKVLCRVAWGLARGGDSVHPTGFGGVPQDKRGVHKESGEEQGFSAGGQTRACPRWEINAAWRAFRARGLVRITVIYAI